MRRISLAFLSLTLAALVLVPVSERSLLAQSQNPTITEARRLLASGQVDVALTLLRNALTTDATNAGLRQALTDALEQKRANLQRELTAVTSELATLTAAAGTVGGSCSGQPPVRVGGAIQAPRRTRAVDADYPAEAMQAKVEGVSVIEVLVGCDGEVARASVLRGVPMLDGAALEAVRQWQYVPTLLNGRPVPVLMTVSVSFSLR